MGYCSGQYSCQPGSHNSPCVCSGSQKPINTLSPASITPLSAPNQANTSGEFKPLTSQEFLCNNRLGFWRFSSVHEAGPLQWGGSGEVQRGEGLPRACQLPGEGPFQGLLPHLSPQEPDGPPPLSLWEDSVNPAWLAPAPALAFVLPKATSEGF